mgnify:CR=1 FL=1
MSKTKSYLMELESQFYTQANASVQNSYTADEAVENVVRLAENMDLIDYLGGIDAIKDMTVNSWYDYTQEQL